MSNPKFISTFSNLPFTGKNTRQVNITDLLTKPKSEPTPCWFPLSIWMASLFPSTYSGVQRLSAGTLPLLRNHSTSVASSAITSSVISVVPKYIRPEITSSTPPITNASPSDSESWSEYLLSPSRSPHDGEFHFGSSVVLSFRHPHLQPRW